jgi:hypothetical protein
MDDREIADRMTELATELRGRAPLAELERLELVQNRPGSPAEVRHASNGNEGSRL